MYRFWLLTVSTAVLYEYVVIPRIPLLDVIAFLRAGDGSTVLHCIVFSRVFLYGLRLHCAIASLCCSISLAARWDVLLLIIGGE